MTGLSANRAVENKAVEIQAVEIKVSGIVQGVGFRPYVYNLAGSLGLKGWVLNSTAGVTIRLEGIEEAIIAFADKLRNNPPPLARIEKFNLSEAHFEGYSSFYIQESCSAGDTEISIPPDVATCPDCLREYNNPENRRHRYDYINCVNCGPRFSITSSAPYDRKNTSMGPFSMCDKCLSEYSDPIDRRFHAEPNACPVCGPQTVVTDRFGRSLSGDKSLPPSDVIRNLFNEGKILAIKGIGGYHLACDALNPAAVWLLRQRKQRENKPFAIMCRNLSEVRRHCQLSPEEEKLLVSPARPIVLLRRRLPGTICEEIAPGLDTLGIMLPYTPLQEGFFDEDLPVLVMTSANISGDPLILTEEEAYAELGGLADAFVIHKREIINRSDDSVVMAWGGVEYFIRRSRGYVPQSIPLPGKSTGNEGIFAAGGDLKSVFAYARGDKVVPSQYFGDLDNLKNFNAYEQGVKFFSSFLKIAPKKVVADLHPGYISTRFAESLGLPLIKVQHHKAHFASCMADNGLNEKVLGVICDGTGYGEDGTVWGGEFFYGDYENIQRVGSLQPYRQPRGDSIQKNPVHMAALLLYNYGFSDGEIVRILPESAPLIPFVKAQTANDNLSIASTSTGRVFDAAAALCGINGPVTYEGEAAMRMEALANNASGEGAKAYPFTIKEDGIHQLSLDFIREMAEDKKSGSLPPVLAARFHRTFGDALLSMLKLLKKEFLANKVVFSGGTFQNRRLIGYLQERTVQTGLEPYFHRHVPANDGGLALGQIMLVPRGV